MSRPNFSLQHDPPRSFPTNFWGCMKSQHSLALIQSLFNSLIVSVLYIQCFMSPCWNWHSQTQFPIDYNPHLHQSQSTMNMNLKSLRSSTPRSTTDIMPANFSTLSNGPATKAMTKKPCGSSHLNLDTHQNSFQISTCHILPNPAPYSCSEPKDQFLMEMLDLPRLSYPMDLGPWGEILKGGILL